MAWIEKPNKKDFKDPKEFEAAMAEFKKAMADKKRSKAFTSPTSEIENDPSWHGADTDFGKDVGTISFNHRVGVALPDDKITYASYPGLAFAKQAQFDEAFNREYGIVCVDLMSTLPKISSEVGYSTLLNQVMNKFNSQVRKANAGAKNYEPVDLLVYNIAYSEAAAFYAACCRIYGAVLNYEKRNAYFSEAYVRAVGGDYNDLVDKLPAFRAFLKSFATRLNALTAVKLPYFQRKIVLCSNTYKDEPEGYNCQIYVPRFRQWLIYEVDPSNGSTLRSSNNKSYYSWQDFSGDFSNMTLAAIQELGNYMLNQLLTDADVATMSGDILKRFEGSDSIVNLAWVDENYYVMPQYSTEFLEEFENMSLALNGLGYPYLTGALVDKGSEPSAIGEYYYITPYGLSNPYLGEITQNSGNICQVNEVVRCGNMLSAGVGNIAANIIKSNIQRTINFKSGEVTPSRLMTATRLLSTTSSVYSYDSGANTVREQMHISQCDTEVVVGLTVYTSVNPNDLSSPYATVLWSDVLGTTQGWIVGNVLAQFKYLCPFYAANVTSTSATLTGIIRNMDKVAVITQANIDGMITCSSMYEFGLNDKSALDK